jgi:hypothetical protein
MSIPELQCVVCDSWVEQQGDTKCAKCSEPETDFIIRDEGSLVMFYPRSQRAQDWWADCVEDGERLGRYWAVERKMAHAIYIGIQEAQFRTGVEE